MYTILLANTFPSMLGCSSLMPSETAFLMHSLFQLQKSTCLHGDGWLMQLRSFFFSSRVNFDCYVWTTITILFVSCNKDSEQFFFAKKLTELEVRYTLLRACSITGASLLLFFNITHDHRPLAVLTLTPPALCFWRLLFLPPYFPLTLFSS